MNWLKFDVSIACNMGLYYLPFCKKIDLIGHENGQLQGATTKIYVNVYARKKSIKNVILFHSTAISFYIAYPQACVSGQNRSNRSVTLNRLGFVIFI